MSLEELFKPCSIGKLRIKNRIYMSPMATNYIAIDGTVTPEYIAYLEERARGGVGFIVTGTTHVEREIVRGSITGANERLDDHKYIIGFSELTDTVHRYGTKIFSQISLGQGAFSIPELFPMGAKPVAPSPVNNPVFKDWVPQVLTIDEIEILIEAFGKASMRAKMAGFDGVEIHGHGMYLIAHFMSPYINKRTDKYGEPTALPLALIKAIKDNAGYDYPITFRFHIDEFLKGGRDLEQSMREAKIYEEAGIHAINVSGGNFWVAGSAANQAPPMSYRPGHLRELAKAMKETVSIPIMLSSKIRNPLLAAEILRNGEADFIGLGRQLLADPYWPKKIEEERLEDIRPCIGDMDGCLNRLMFKRITCTVNPRCGKEKSLKITPTNRPKNVIVVGGGVGGMEAARVASLRGHNVTLYEKSGNLGGQVRWASMVPFKGDLFPIIEYLKTQIKKIGVATHLSQEVTPESIEKAKPDAVIVATGSKPFVPQISGANRPNVFMANEVVAGAVEVTGNNIVVAGAGFVGCDTALFLTAKQQKEVTVIEALTLNEVGFEPYNMNHMDLMKMLEDHKVNIMFETKLEEISDTGVLATCKSGETLDIKADSIVLALGATPDRTLYEALKGKVQEIYAIGDCCEPGKIIEAMHQGFYVAFEL